MPLGYPGAFRRVYPGFLQLSGFVSMNFGRHMEAHVKQFDHLVEGDGDSADKHRAFYAEYNAVMDLTAEYYLQTIETVFQKQALAKGEMMYRGDRPVRTDLIKKTAIMTVEGELDDISGIGQTVAAHDICTALPESMKTHYEQKGVGHYGVFNGSKFRSEIAPRISDFILNQEPRNRARFSQAQKETAEETKKPVPEKAAMAAKAAVKAAPEMPATTAASKPAAMKAPVRTAAKKPAVKKAIAARKTTPKTTVKKTATVSSPAPLKAQKSPTRAKTTAQARRKPTKKA